MNFKLKKNKDVKDQFILSIGDEGAVFSHFDDGKLANKLFVESPLAPDIGLIEKLMAAYPKVPVHILVDVIEQNYSQQVLPPVSSLGIRQQIQRRMKRDFQPNDLNNVYPLGRSKEGRKDWNFLFISLANADPFAKWLDFVLRQNNDFKGVYLLPVEAMRLIGDIGKVSMDPKKSEWELLVLHNKVGGFRITAFKNGKLIFTRLALNLIGDNVAEIIVGNMEQEIFNTVEYLRRLTFKGEAESKITIIAGADILRKVDPKVLKFGTVQLLTPYQLANKLALPPAVTEKDKFADILVATHFAVTKKHLLKFDSPYTRQIAKLYQFRKLLYGVFVLIMAGLVGYSGYELYNIIRNSQDIGDARLAVTQSSGRLKDIQAKKATMPEDIDKILEIRGLAKLLENDKYKGLRLVNKLEPLFGDRYLLKTVSYKNTTPELKEGTPVSKPSFDMQLDVEFIISARDIDVLNTIATDFLRQVSQAFPKNEVTYLSPPKIENQSQFEQVFDANAPEDTKTIAVPGVISIKGELDEI